MASINVWHHSDSGLVTARATEDGGASLQLEDLSGSVVNVTIFRRDESVKAVRMMARVLGLVVSESPDDA